MKIFKHFIGVTGFLMCSFIIALMFFRKLPWPRELRDMYEESTNIETGAPNIVSAIYLGYRAYDTLGETIVLYIAVSGTLYMIKQSIQKKTEPNIARGKATKHRRTGIIGVITAKLGPAILMFGLYIMAFGYRSPGGGFQGGAVVASGIVILAFSFMENHALSLERIKRLKKLEKLLFAALVLFFSLGLVAGRGFLASPFNGFLSKPVIYISLLNVVIGLKVGVSIGLLCITMLLEEYGE